MSVLPQSQERILGWPAYLLPRPEKKVLPRLAEYDDVIRGLLFSLVSPPSQP